MHRYYRKIIPLLVVVSFLLGCATSYDARGKYHRVQRGETIFTIADGYGISVQELAEFNNVQDPKDLPSGRKLYVPERKSKHPQYKRLPWDLVDKDKNTYNRSYKRSQKSQKEEVKFERGIFLWPVKGKLLSKFGMRDGVPHEGIDIKAEVGTPIKAAADGKVVYSSQMRGYGNIIILKHKNEYFTAYAHNKVNLAKKGKSVKQGDKIAEVGKTGRTTGPHLHFEIRHKQRPRNPLFFLPER